MAAPIVFDRHAYAMRRLRAERAGSESFLERDVAEVLAERLAAVKRSFQYALDLSARPSIAAALEPCAQTWVRTRLAHQGRQNNSMQLVADEEALPFAGQSFDLVVSALSLHAVNDLPGALVQIRRALVPDGLLVAALFGGSTLGELRSALIAGETGVLGGASPRVAPFADVRSMGALLQRAGFVMPVVDLERRRIRYTSFLTLVSDLRALGETNVLAGRKRSFLRRDVLSAALADYAAAHPGSDGKLPVTFDLLFVTAWAPREKG